MDATLARKLQLKPGQALRVYEAPAGIDLEQPSREDAAGAAGPAGAAGAATIVFVGTFAEAEERVAPAVAAALADELAWVAYPKAGKLGTDLNRDSLAALMTARGVRPVRQVAIDDTWSALRFRPPSP
jgi:hypothetical protein